MTWRRGAALAALWIGSLAATFALARREPPPARAIVPAAAQGGSTVRERCVASGGGGLTDEGVRAILRQELASLRGQDAPPPPEEHAGPSPSFAPAAEIVDVALARGVWTARDRDALRSRLPGLRRDEAELLFQSLVPAANDGRLRVEGIDGPLI